jgi:regulator of RNase E activity RraA
MAERRGLPPGRCLIYPPGPTAPAELLGRFRQLGTALVSDCLDRSRGVVGVQLLLPGLVQPGRAMVGPALTVKVAPGDNLALHQAMELITTGAVLVVDAGGAIDRAIAGEILCRLAWHRGAIGMVVDGAVRDTAAMGDLRFSLFGRANIHLGPYKNGPGEIHGAVSAGGAVVQSGDIVVGDSDGVVVVPLSRAEAVVAAAESKADDERRTLAQIEAGTYQADWLRDAVEPTWFST